MMAMNSERKFILSNALNFFQYFQCSDKTFQIFWIWIFLKYGNFISVLNVFFRVYGSRIFPDGLQSQILNNLKSIFSFVYLNSVNCNSELFYNSKNLKELEPRLCFFLK